ncbi:Arrestin-like, N-terminal [Penicillium camemberti]|uniref:Arrestin-like, N-terminal n=1 Tax=Penicillium camemberti (strain FM 013) TaxID=1429867 RepID=A0A0G4PEH2_PENC3|nr:Arrestin-like, N-terminal [Penicillium camemberti]
MFRKQITRSELSLDQACIFISEDRHPVAVTGRLNLTLAQVVSVKGIKVRLRGIFAIPIEGILGSENREQITFEREQPLASSKTLTAFQMPAGDHAFLFDIPLPSKVFDTATGANHQYHTYRVEAIIERRLKSDFVISQPVRIYQVSDLETSYLRPHCPLTLEGHSDENIQYCLSITDRNVPFGCTFPVECWFAPLWKYAKLSTVTVKVIEKQTARLDATAAESAQHNMRFITAAQSQTIFSKTVDFSRDESPVGDDSEIEWRFTTPVSLPQSLDACSQSISTKHLKITHEISILAEFHNEAGDVIGVITEVMPFKIYMTPNVIGDNASIHGQDIQLMQGSQSPPPAYSDRFSDLIVSAATQLNICEQPRLAEINSARSSSEQSAGIYTMDPAPRYEQVV